MTKGSIFDTASPADDPEGFVSKYIQYECFRLTKDHFLNDMKGSLQDRFKVLMWYLVDYVAHRKGQFEVPLSEKQIKFLNSPMPIAGGNPAITIALWNFVLKELPSHIQLDQPHVLREALYWWCIEKTGSGSFSKALVTEAQLKILRTDIQWIDQNYPFNYFMIFYFNKNTDFHQLDANIERDRVVFFCYLMVLGYSNINIAQLLSRDLVRKTLEEDHEGFCILDKFLSRYGYSSVEPLSSGKKLRKTFEDLYRENTGDSFYGYCQKNEGNSSQSINISKYTSKVISNGIAVIGPIHQTSGLGQATRLSYNIICEAEDTTPTALPFALDNPAPVGFTTKTSIQLYNGPKKINLIHLNAESIPMVYAFEDNVVLKDSYNIGYFFWELNVIPKCHYLALELLDEIWVSSEYNREIYLKYTNKPVINVGMAVEQLPNVPKADLRKFGVKDDDVVFLTTFDSFSFIERKNPIAVVEAFKAAFPNNHEKVKLIIKTQNRAKVGDAYQIDLWKRIDRIIYDDNRITVVNETMKYLDLISLKSACDCYISLHRSEGWGFGMIEAMQLAKPVIATAYGGNMDFCNNENAYLIDYDLITVRPEEYIFVERGSLWADPNVQQASAAMKAVAGDISAARSKGIVAQKFVTENFSISPISRRYRKRLDIIRREFSL
jgi:glycosyltransferase involved in cell wall biosynthesis